MGVGGSGVAVEAAEEEVDAEVGHEQRGQGQEGVEPIVAVGTEPGEALLVEGQAVDDECDEGPGFLGVPGPVGAPGDVGPDGAEEDAGGQQEHGGAQEAAAHDADDQQDVGEQNGADVEEEEGRTQDGHQGAHGDGYDHVGGHDGAADAQQEGGEPRGGLGLDGGVAAAGQADPHHADGQEQVADVGDGRAPGVVADGEGAALEVVVEGGLIDAVALGAPDVVHADGGGVLAVGGGYDDVADVVAGRGAVGVVEHAELAQCQVEGEFPGEGVGSAFVLHPAGAGGFALAQVCHAPVAGEVGGECPGQDDEQADVEQHDGGTAPHLAPDEQPAGAQGRQQPEGDEPPGSVDVAVGIVGAEAVLDERGCGDDDGHQTQTEEREQTEAKGGG